MANILNYIQPGSIFDVYELPRSASRQEWFAITRRIVQATIADMDLDLAAERRSLQRSQMRGCCDAVNFHTYCMFLHQ